VVARGRRVILRRKRMVDIQEDYAWRSDEELTRLDASAPLRLSFSDYARNWNLDMRFTDTPTRYFAIEDEGGRRIGNVMFYNLNRSRAEAEVGISVGDRTAWGKGYGSDAMHTASRYFLEREGLKRLYLHTLESNMRAQKAFRRAGFVTSGVSWRDGQSFVVMELRPGAPG